MRGCTVPMCLDEGELLPRGYRCTAHRAPAPTPDPAFTAVALMAREQVATAPRAYGTATTDPLGRDGPLNRLGIPTRTQPEKRKR